LTLQDLATIGPQYGWIRQPPSERQGRDEPLQDRRAEGQRRPDLTENQAVDV
jgi:hypothetical protein